MTAPPATRTTDSDPPAPLGVDRYGLDAQTARRLRWAPLWIVLPFLPLAATQKTRNFFYWFCGEDRPVEGLTFIFLVLAGYLGIRICAQLRRTGANWPALTFYVLFTVGMFLTAGEEIAWGQKIFFFKTPAFWEPYNAQHELTLHNYNTLQGHSEYIRLIFCTGALIGLILGRLERFQSVAVPPVLWPWVLVMLGHVILDTLNDSFPTRPELDHFINKFSEVTEMMIAMTAYFYLRLNANLLGLSGKGKFLLKRTLM